MDDPLGVGVLDRGADLVEEFEPVDDGEAVLVAVGRDGLALDQLHHEVRASCLGGPVVEGPRYVRVIHHGEGLALGLEPGDHLAGIHAELDDLQGHPTFDRMFLLRLEDRTEASFADALEDLVGPDCSRAWSGGEPSRVSALEIGASLIPRGPRLP